MLAESAEKYKELLREEPEGSYSLRREVVAILKSRQGQKEGYSKAETAPKKPNSEISPNQYQQLGSDYRAEVDKRLRMVTGYRPTDIAPSRWKLLNERRDLLSLELRHSGVDVALLEKKAAFSLMRDLYFQKIKGGLPDPRFKTWMDFFKR